MTDALADPLVVFAEQSRRFATSKLYRLYAKVWPGPMDGSVPPDGSPYPWQADFHAAGRTNPERMLISANQVGKNTCAAAEVACHLTGWYPPWWQGHRYTRQNDWLCAGISAQLVKKSMQEDLLGPMDEGVRRLSGTGWIPWDCIHHDKVSFRQCGVADVVDEVRVKHVCGRYSTVSFMAYEQGSTKFQAFKKDGAWLDEEPEENVDQASIYSEVQTRLVARKGLMLCTRTPLFGMTKFVKHFLDGGPGIYYKNVGWDQAPHLSADEKARLIASYPPHERATRTTGSPMMGSGSVFPVSDDEIICKPFPIPEHYRRICGIDFGLDDAGAAVWIAHDGDRDVVYVYDCYKQSGWTAGQHSIAIRKRGDWIPVSWPHDGLNREKSSGAVLVEQYDLPSRLGISARYDDEKGGGQDKGPWVNDALERMLTGRLKVFSTLPDWLEEKRMYHRKDNKIVDGNDHLLDATRYAMIMLRYAATEVSSRHRQVRSERKRSPLSGFIRACGIR